MKTEYSTMKKYVLLSIAALAIFSTSGVSVAGDQDFTLVNKTGYVLDQVYVAPSASKDWANDVLGQDVLAEDGSAKIVFPKANEVCKYDLKVVYEIDKSEVEWSDIDLCKESKITIHWDKATDTSSATFE